MGKSSKEPADHLTPVEVVTRWKHTVTMATLANWRSNGSGPKYLKIGGRVLYRRADIEAWESQNHREPKAAR